MTKMTGQRRRVRKGAANRRLLLVGSSALEPLFKSAGDVVEVAGWEELFSMLVREHPANIVLVELGSSNADNRVCELLDRFPSATVVPVLTGAAGDVPRMRRLLDAGASELINLALDTADTARVMLESACAKPYKRMIEAHVTRFIDADARVLVAAAAEVAVSGGGVAELAGKFSVNPRTLVGWCARTALPEPRRLQAWMRVLLAAQLLDDPGRTMWDVAVACGYSTDRSLRRVIKDLLKIDLEVRILRRSGMFSIAVHAFNEELRSLREDRRSARSMQPGKVVVPMQANGVCVSTSR